MKSKYGLTEQNRKTEDFCNVIMIILVNCNNSIVISTTKANYFHQSYPRKESISHDSATSLLYGRQYFGQVTHR